ncbi:TadG family pilus assembly protein [Thiorhodococcus minor]|uniref:DUF2134 domain-containing protein n=1 Tax=Thiorhodococcus minor TaxID=57489 RepID=A0A6M0JZX0_9GAMM|nr:TadG family pilus assembly protein [Thiorhodococcus minor]NEV63032.1 hypothetical protein [Thiorhodococcus minor]
MTVRLHKRQQRGASLVHFILVIVPLLAMGAFAVDMGNVLMWQAALQRSVDAAALEGARMLYCDDGLLNHTDDQCGSGITSADNAARSLAEDNLADAGATITVERGHWAFQQVPDESTDEANEIKRGGFFTPNATTSPSSLSDTNGKFRPLFDPPGEDLDDLNSDTDDINAVRVQASRLNPSLFGLFAKLDSYQGRATAVAYIGFAGKIAPDEVDVPIAMCQETIDVGCHVGRLIPETDQSGGWTDYLQPGNTPGSSDVCSGAKANDQGGFTGYGTFVDRICSDTSSGNPWELYVGEDMQVKNGQDQNVFSDLFERWQSNCNLDTDADGWPDKPIVWTMPVIENCKFTGHCAPLYGAVQVEVLWMFDKNPDSEGVDGIDNTAPWEMEDWSTDPVTVWSSSSADGEVRWNSFVQHFDLQMKNDEGQMVPATFEAGGATQKTMYFRPGCKEVTLGGTGGINFGVRAEVPVLVF